MRLVVPLIRVLAISSLLSSLCIGSAVAQQPKGTAISATPTSISTDDKSCELRVINNLIQECCSQVGTYLAGYRNCTLFRRTFDTLCKRSLGRSRCRSVTILCPNGKGHAINLVQMSDGNWYLVEPQGWVYEDYPLPSADLTDAAVSAVMPGCGCHAEVSEWAPLENTNPFGCTQNETLLYLYGDKGSSMKQRCIACCNVAPIPPEHPDPKDFRETCMSACSDDLNLPGDKYCPSAYTGRACEECCMSFHADRKGSRPKNACEASCNPGGDQWGEVPAEGPTYCSTKTKSRSECYSCCQHEKQQCMYPESWACSGWATDCGLECYERFPQIPTPTPTATPTIAATVSPSAAGRR